MNKLGRRQYLKLIMESIKRSYGSSITEYGTSEAMAEELLEGLRPYLHFHPLDMSDDEWKRFLAKHSRKGS